MRVNLFLGLIFAGGIAYGVIKDDAILRGRPAPIPEAAPGQSPTAPRPINGNVVAYHTSDEAMNSAMRMGQSTLPRFRKLIAEGTPGVYSIKFPLTQNGETEHIWLQLTGARGNDFVGRLANDPENGSKYRRGDSMTVAAADVEDWMINNGKEIYGGYTTRVALGQLPKEQQDKYRAMFRD